MLACDPRLEYWRVINCAGHGAAAATAELLGEVLQLAVAVLLAHGFSPRSHLSDLSLWMSIGGSSSCTDNCWTDSAASLFETGVRCSHGLAAIHLSIQLQPQCRFSVPASSKYTCCGLEFALHCTIPAIPPPSITQHTNLLKHWASVAPVKNNSPEAKQVEFLRPSSHTQHTLT